MLSWLGLGHPGISKDRIGLGNLVSAAQSPDDFDCAAMVVAVFFDGLLVELLVLGDHDQTLLLNPL